MNKIEISIHTRKSVLDDAIDYVRNRFEKFTIIDAHKESGEYPFNFDMEWVIKILMVVDKEKENE